MTVGYIRPDVADMVLRVLERSVHPELFDTLCQTTSPVGRNQATLRISNFGHSIEFRTDQKVITEVEIENVYFSVLEPIQRGNLLYFCSGGNIMQFDMKYKCTTI